MRQSPIRILIAAVVAQTGSSFLEQGVPTLVVFVKRDLGLSAAAAGAIVSVMGLGRLSGFYTAGRAVDRHGERRVLFLGASAAGVLMMIAANLPFAGFLMLAFLVGTCLSTSTPAGGKLVYTAFGDRGPATVTIRPAGITNRVSPTVPPWRVVSFDG